VLSSLVWAQQTGPQTAAPQTPAPHKAAVPKKKKRVMARKKPVEAVVAQPLPAQTMPPVPATLMNSTPVKPSVTLDNGMLTIDAPNSTLSDVLSGVRKATGAVIEGASPSERIAVRLGPGNPRQVIAALLHGTAYDYVILGSQEKQDVVTRVVLRQKEGAGAEDSQAAQGGARPERHRAPDAAEEEAADQATPAEDATAPQPAEPEPAAAQPTPDQNQSKSPEQLFRELQQVQQQQQQQQQQPQQPQPHP
jgi:hypothetical protein